MNLRPFRISPERRWLLAFALATMTLLTLPYALGFAVQGDDWRFTGFVFGVEDGNSYIAKMQRGAAGDWLFRTPYTAYPQRGTVYLPYLLLGKLAPSPAPHGWLVTLYHLARFAAGVAAIFAVYDFTALFIRGTKWRRWGIALTTWGGGLGWMLLLGGRTQFLGSLPLEFYSPESFGFLALFGIPHLAMARALMFWGLTAYLRAEIPPWKSGLLWLLMSFFQPLDVPVVWAVMGVHLGLLFLRARLTGRPAPPSWHDGFRWARRAAVAGLLSAPMVFYTLIAFSADPVLRQWKWGQSILPSPHPLHYLLAYGLLLPLALPAAWRLWRRADAAGLWLPAWMLAFPVLVYAPVNVQRRLAVGFWVALATLALLTLESLPEVRARKLRWALLLAFPSALILLLGGFGAAAHPQTPLFRPADETAAFGFLAETASSEPAALTSFKTGNPLPAWAPLFVVIGHGPESVFLRELQPRVAAFYTTGTSDARRLALLDEFGVDYVFYGPAERALGDWPPSGAGYLDRVFRQGTYEVYRVVR